MGSQSSTFGNHSYFLLAKTLNCEVNEGTRLDVKGGGACIDARTHNLRTLQQPTP